MKLQEILKDTYIESEDILLRHHKEEDEQGLYSLLSDRESCYMDGGYEPMAEYSQEFLPFFHDIFLKDKTRFCIVDRNTNTPVGIIHVMEEDSRKRCIELGYSIFPAYRRKGYAYKGVKLMLDYLFAQNLADTVLLGALKKNTASLHLIQKLGFHYEETQKDEGYDAWEKKPCDLEYYSLSRIEYQGKYYERD